MPRYYCTGWLIIIFLFTTSIAFPQPPYPATPVTNKGKKWRIAYIEGGSYRDYQVVLYDLIESLIEMGWIAGQPMPRPEDPKETRTLWHWLSKEGQSGYLSFPEDAYWSAGWDRERHKKNAADLIRRLNTKKDIDLVLAFGTLAGRSLANDLHSVPTLICSVSDAVKSGIIPNAGTTGA